MMITTTRSSALPRTTPLQLQSKDSADNSGGNISRSALTDAVNKTPQERDWVVMDGRLQPMTFLQRLEHYQGNTIGEVAASAASQIDTLDKHRQTNSTIGWVGVGIMAAGCLAGAVLQSPGLAIGSLVGGFLPANYGFVGASWDRDEIASTQNFVHVLGEWGSLLNRETNPPAK